MQLVAVAHRRVADPRLVGPSADRGGRGGPPVKPGLPALVLQGQGPPTAPPLPELGRAHSVCTCRGWGRPSALSSDALPQKCRCAEWAGGGPRAEPYGADGFVRFLKEEWLSGDNPRLVRPKTFRRAPPQCSASMLR